MLWVCPPIIIQNTSIFHAKRQVFNRAPNFVIAPRLFTFQNTSNSQSKTYLRTSFLQNSSQWLLSQMSVIFLGRQKQKQLSIPPLCLIRKSIFRILIFHERLQKVYHEHLSVVYTMKLSWNTHFMKCSERNISQCILAFRFSMLQQCLSRLPRISSRRFLFIRSGKSSFSFNLYTTYLQKIMLTSISCIAFVTEWTSIGL